MKAEFLKLAGVKSEKAFYKKYPTEAAFFKAHPEAKKMTKKAQFGNIIPLEAINAAQNFSLQDMLKSQMMSGGVNNNMFNNMMGQYGPRPAVQSVMGNLKPAGVVNNFNAPAGMPNISEELGTPGFDFDSLASSAGNIIGGIQSIQDGRKRRKEAEKWANVTGVQARAAETEDIDDFRQYSENMNRKRRAFMPVNTGEEFFPIYGVGTNVLARNGVKLEGGGMVGGNPTEIQNTYSPNYDIYSDLEYEPLYNVNQVKSYQFGGSLPWQSFGKLGGMGAASLTGNDGGGQVGGTLGSVAGSLIGGPIGGAIGETLGTLVGGLFDTNDRDRRKAEARIRNNQNRMIASQMKETNKQMFGSYMEDGGYVSNDWNPQVIAKFGELDEQDFARFAHKDEFRAGGHLKKYTAPSERAMQTFAMGGELQTHWGGYAEPMSYNPYLPDGGETIMFRGKSHEEYSPNGETGIGITYGDNPVEVERGEPAVKLKDGGTGEDNLTVYGNLMIPFGEGKGKKFKNYVADLSKIEDKQNKLIDKSTNELDALNVRSSFDKLKLASLEANIKGGNMKLKEIADKKINAADLQNAINETAEEYGLVADDLARGKVKVDKKAMKEYAEFGGEYTRLQDGGKTPKFTSEEAARKAGFEKNAQGKWVKVRETRKRTTTEKRSASAMDTIPKQSIDKSTGLFGGITPEQFEAYKKKNAWYPDWETFDPNDPEDVDRYAKAFNVEAEKRGSKARILPDDLTTGKTKFVGKQFTSANLEDLREETPAADALEIAEVEELDTRPIPYERSGLIDFANQLLPFIRPTDQEELDPTQLMGEMFALSTNKLEPVQAQPYTPQLRVPFDISRQAAKNDLIAQTRAAQRMAQGNPAMQAMIAAQAYGSMQQLNEQDFIDNQRMKDAVYSGNIATLNDAELTNLAIYDQQYERQEAAKSNTKATAQAALNSIADKYAKNRLENRTLGVYENLYNYRYDDRGRAINMNPLFQPNIPTVGGVDATQKQVPVKDASGKVLYYQLEEYDPSAKGGVGTPPLMPVKNGKSIVKKNNKNSSIVKAIKNL